MKDHFNNGKNVTKKPLDLNLKNKQIGFFSEFSLGYYVNIPITYIISSDVDMNQ